jgi:NAD(P)-dependent dehydrogenase (short-subunit alcohol dehydrogenase family)
MKGYPVISIFNRSKEAIYFSKQNKKIALRGPLTPDHVIRTKRVPAILNKNYKKGLKRFVKQYQEYFNKYSKDETILNTAPNFAILKNCGTLSFGSDVKEANIIKDINNHTFQAILKAEIMDSYTALNPKDIFDVEYWSLEQAKLKKNSSKPILAGKVAIVSGGASGIGKSIATTLNKNGSAVVVLDIDNNVTKIFNTKSIKGFVCDLTKSNDIKKAIKFTIENFGGIDIVVSNAGVFTTSETLDNISQSNWQKSIKVNLTSHQKLLKETIPYLKLGIDPSIVMIASKNFPAPGVGAGSYSVAKAGQTQLARIAALELGKYAIRVNTIHPHLVFDTSIWSDEVLKKRAKAYNMSVEEYKTNNILKTNITSQNVADLTLAMVTKAFAKTTGAQVALDGGSDRII